jgi:hypothetical protein
MDIKIQLLSFLFSFLFGIFFYFTSFINYKMIKNYSVIFRYLISLFYALDIALLYILMMYKINYGVIHIYFVMILFVGYYMGMIYCKKLRKKCKIKDKKLKE